MKRQESLFKPMLSVVAAALLAASPMAGAETRTAIAGSDFAFNEMVRDMSGRDTGSLWFDYYVETVNQEIALKSDEPYGAAGPSGPLAGFDGYVASFTQPDTGSIWFDTYVDGVNRDLRAKGY